MPEQNDPPSQAPDPDQALDPLFVHAKRELKVSIIAFIVFGVWVVGFSWAMGRTDDPENIGSILGIPTWAFWGVAAPWLVANIFIFWFCFGFMKDDPLVQVDGEHAEGDPQ